MVLECLRLFLVNLVVLLVSVLFIRILSITFRSPYSGVLYRLCAPFTRASRASFSSKCFCFLFFRFNIFSSKSCCAKSFRTFQKNYSKYFKNFQKMQHHHRQIFIRLLRSPLSDFVFNVFVSDLCRCFLKKFCP